MARRRSRSRPKKPAAASPVRQVEFSSDPTPPMTSREKRDFLLLVKVLMLYLEKKDVLVYVRAKQTIKDALAENAEADAATLLIKTRLRHVVCKDYWKQADKFLQRQLQKKKQQQNKQNKQAAATDPPQELAKPMPELGPLTMAFFCTPSSDCVRGRGSAALASA